MNPQHRLLVRNAGYSFSRVKMVLCLFAFGHLFVPQFRALLFLPGRLPGRTTALPCFYGKGR